jgi:hypothetical protein
MKEGFRCFSKILSKTSKERMIRLIQIGTRVGAICDADEEVNLFGYGIYVGEEIPPKGVTFLGIDLNSIGRKNPKIVLDNGDIVWGCQCWWGPEEEIKQAIGGRKVNIVPVPSIK